MNRTKKLISLLLAIALVMVFPATAFATDMYANTYVDGFYNQDNQYCLRIGKIGIWELTTALSALYSDDPQTEFGIKVQCKFSNGDVLTCGLDQDGQCFAIILTADERWSDYNIDLLGARLFSNDNKYVDSGFVIFFNGDADFLDILKSSEKVEVTAFVYNGDAEYGIDENAGTWHTIKTSLEGLEAVDEPVVDEPVVDEPVVDEPVADEPVADEPVADEPVADEPVADEPVVDEPVADEPAVDEPAADEPVVDEPAADEPVVDEPVADEPAVDEPVADEPTVDEPAADTPVVDTNNTVDTGKDNPDTGAEGIAAITAIGITAIGAALLSKKKK